MVLVIRANPADRAGHPSVRQGLGPRRIHLVFGCVALCLQSLGTNDLKYQNQRTTDRSNEESPCLAAHIHSLPTPQDAHAGLAGFQDANHSKRVSCHPCHDRAARFQYRQMFTCNGKRVGLKEPLDLIPIHVCWMYSAFLCSRVLNGDLLWEPGQFLNLFRNGRPYCRIHSDVAGLLEIH